jgi:hypothetical protein
MRTFKVYGVQKLELDLNEDEVKRIAIRYLCEKFDWSEEFFIENDEVCKIVSYSTSHRWDQKESVRKATQGDKHIYSILKDIKKLP